MLSLSALLHSAASADVSEVGYTALALGILFHVSIPSRNTEFENSMLLFVATSCVSFVLLNSTFIAVEGLDIFASLALTTFLFASFNAGVLLSTSTYRLFFHRLRSFPGPFAAKLTKFHALYRALRFGQLHRDREALHAQYGDVVRVGPRELSIMRKSAIPLIYGPGTDCRKSTWYAQEGTDMKSVSLHMDRDHKSHRLRRRAWDRGFSQKACVAYEPRVATQAGILIDNIRRMDGRPLNITKWAMFYSFDVMGAVAFQKDFNQMNSGIEHPAVQGIHDTMDVMGGFGNVPWIAHFAPYLPGAMSGFATFFGLCENELKEKMEAYEGEKMPQDILSWLLKAKNEGDSTAPPTRKALEADVRFMILAGSDSTATTLAYSLYFLARYPEKQRKLRAELSKAIPGGIAEWSYAKAKEVSYLDDFINETLRLKPPLLLGIQRETSDKGLRIDDDIFIPPRTNVMVPMQQMQKDPRYWPQAAEFIPERWNERREEMQTDDAPFFAFCMGPHLCAGKIVAYISMRTALSKLVMAFDVAFAPGEDGVAFDTQELETFSTVVPPLQLVFTVR